MSRSQTEQNFATMICRRFLPGAIFRKSCLKVSCGRRLLAIDGRSTNCRVLSSSLSTLAEESSTISDQFPIINRSVMRDGTDLNALLQKMKESGDFYSDSVELSRLLNETSHDAISSVKEKWMSEEDLRPYDILVSSDYNARYARQLSMEEQQQSDAVKDYNESLLQLISIGRCTGLRYVQRVLLRWYEPLTRLIDSEIVLIEAKKSGHDRMVN